MKNKTLRKEGRKAPRAVYGLGEELHRQNWRAPLGNSCSQHSLVLHILNVRNRGQKEGVRDVQCRSLCARKQKQDSCVMQAKEKGLAMDSR